MSNRNQKVFAVTGVDHGSIVYAKSKAEAKRIFKKAWNGERIIYTKNISDYNLENL